MSWQLVISRCWFDGVGCAKSYASCCGGCRDGSPEHGCSLLYHYSDAASDATRSAAVQQGFSTMAFSSVALPFVICRLSHGECELVARIWLVPYNR